MSRLPMPVWIRLLGCCFLATAGLAAGGAASLRLATFSADVTVPLGHGMMGGSWLSKSIADPLEAHGFVLLGGDAPVVFVSVDWCEIRNDAYERWQTVLAEAAGTKPGRVLVTTVHQHDAPVADLAAEHLLRTRKLAGTICDPDFHERAVQEVAKALRQSLEFARPFTHIGTGQAKVGKIASNRRYTMPDGSVCFDRTSSTRKAAAIAADEGLIDPWLKTLSFWDGETPLAAVSFYAVHPMSHYGAGEVSADFPGLARRKRQAEMPGVKQIYCSGCSGNLTAGKYNDGASENRAVLADRLHAAMVAAWRNTKRRAVDHFDLRVTPLRLEPRNGPGFTIAELEAKLTPATKPFQQCLAAMGLSWRHRVDAGHRIQVPSIDFGVAQLLLLPGESYVEFQLAAQHARPDSFVCVAGYGEAATGYIPTENHIAEHDTNLEDWCWVAPGSEQPMLRAIRAVLAVAGPAGDAPPLAPGTNADLILHNGKVATVDGRFTIQQAVAIADGRILQAGQNPDILNLRGPRTEVVDLQGKLVLPGLMDSHVHPANACMTEFSHPIPPMERIQDVLDYIQARTRVLDEGEWIEVRQVFITRLQEQRYPTRAELDRVAPKHPVLFATGPDASLNSLALRLSGMDRDFKVTDGGSGFAEKDPKTGELTGILRNCTRDVKVKSAPHPPSRADKARRLKELFADYNSAGITSVCDRDAGLDDIETYRELRTRGELTARVHVSQHIESIGSLAAIQESIRQVSRDPLFKERDDWLRIIGIKTYLDGGMLTGSAYMRQPWGVSEIYSISDPTYRGVRFIPRERLVPMVRTAVECGLQFTAHSVGDGAVHALLEAYAEVDKDLPVRKTRPCISHSNFMSREAVQEAARLGVMVDIQPAWLYLDTHTLAKQFGYERLRYFQPLHSLFEAGVVAGGGSDHMQKIGSLRSVNPYNPFLGMATAILRHSKRYEKPLHAEEALTREQAIRFYTINNARILGCDDKLGSLEPGKLADLIVLDTDLLNCPEDKIAATQVLRTYVGGKMAYRRENPAKP